MNAPHVDSLRYRLKTDESLEFADPPSLESETPTLRLRLENNVVTVWPKTHHPSAEHAREEVDPYLRAWEISEAVRRGRRKVRFEYQSAEVVDRAPSPDGPQTTRHVVSKFDTLRSVSRAAERSSSYPAPPETFVASPDVETMWQRYEQYVQGREPLLSMAYFCLTVLENSARGVPGKGNNRAKASRIYDIEYEVLDKLGALTSGFGDGGTARKADGAGRPLTPNERDWIERCLLSLIRRVGEKAADPQGKFDRLTMADLTKL